MFEKYHYLYVEDDPLSREIMQVAIQEIMGAPGLTVFESSENFIGRLRSLNPTPDLIMLDIHMEPVDGFEMLRLLRTESDFCDKIVIALTASVMNEEIRKLQKIGFDGAIGKPINVTKFPELIARVLNGESVWEVT
ncbi:MAG: response regulator [Chloroflexota bacterium]